MRSVANLTRNDAKNFLTFAAHNPLHVKTTRYDLTNANEELADLRNGRLTGAAVLALNAPEERGAWSYWFAWKSGNSNTTRFWPCLGGENFAVRARALEPRMVAVTL